MGLAASQARLLTITSRKADCEFQSMRYSHQKIALSRNMNDISNEYQNALEQTKLIYDYYGTGDASNPLTYGLMMTPSELNGHMPILTTDGSGKTVLNTQYAAAARAAGIPQEGLGCLPSTTIRNKFIQSMADAGLITPETALTFQGIPYAQEMGVGTTDLVTTVTEKMTLADMLDEYIASGNATLTTLTHDSVLAEMGSYDWGAVHIYDTTVSKSSQAAYDGSLSIKDLISGDIVLVTGCEGGTSGAVAGKFQNLSIYEWIYEELAKMLSVSGNQEIAGAIQYAESMTRELWTQSFNNIKSLEAATDEGDQVMLANSTAQRGYAEGFVEFFGAKQDGSVSTSDWFGPYALDRRGNLWNWKPVDYAAIDLSNFADAYLTYFAQYMQGGERLSDYNIDEAGRNVSSSNIIDINDENFYFDVEVESGINTDQALQSGFYDAMFNQICQNGWVENANVDDKNYLQEMLQNGMLFIATCSEDGHYYQGNYSTNTFIKEIVDEEAIARAEAKYNAEKQKINSKEEVIDMKMKNLDTEISSLTTEYDTVKSLLSKNIEKSFKRYDA